MSELLGYIEERVSLNAEERDAVVSAFKPVSGAKNEVIIKANQTARYLYFIQKGLIRTYSETDTREITSWIYPEGLFATGWYSFLRQEPSPEYVQCLEDCELMAISHEQLQSLYKSYPNLDRFGRLLMQEQFAFLDYFSRGYYFLSAREKYELLLSYFPEIELRAKIGHIASMLGISIETLSRIRSGNRGS
ncbi:Crp/Fnr family transcriptional regulator [bacterium SCSIO 12741]|nr:Crp/Fnr family transcriptional regulator [bacterium SCSIO 12741]